MEPVKRQTAYVCSVKDLVEGTYTRREGWEPNFVSTSKGAVSRVQFAGIVVEKSSANDVLVDDGTGKMTVRRFEDVIRAEVGQPVLVVGRPREYGGEIYVVSEVLRLLPSAGWIKYFSWLKGEVSKYIPSVPKEQPVHDANPKDIVLGEDDNVKPVVDASSSSDGPVTNVAQELINIIRELDPGDGAPTDEVLARANFDNAEDKLQFLIEEGEVFELRAGKIKVLE